MVKRDPSETKDAAQQPESWLSVPLEVKFSNEKSGMFSGYGAFFGNVDRHQDVIQPGAFASSLKEWKDRNKLPPMLLQHGGFFGSVDDMLPIGKWTSMYEDSQGLKVEGQLFALDTERGKYLLDGMKSGALDGLSIGYVPRKSVMGTRAGEPRRTLQDVDLREVSVVLFPSNDRARIGQAKADLATAMTDERTFERFLRTAGFSRKFAKVVTAAGFKAAVGSRDPDKDRRAEISRALQSANETLKSLRRLT